MIEYDRAKHVEKCRSKQWFNTVEEAQEMASNQLKVWDQRMVAYRCHICNLFHLTKRIKTDFVRKEFKRQEEEYRKTPRRVKR